MSGSFVQRAIDLTFKIGSGPYGDGPQTTVVLTGLRVQVSIQNAGIPSAAQAHLRVFGVSPSLINQISTLGLHHYSRLNAVQVAAGVPGKTALVFDGIVLDAYADFGAPPQMALTINAQATGIIQVRPVPPSSFSGTTSVAVIMGQFAAQAGLTLENSGVSVQLSNPYFKGTVWDQIIACARAANINAFVDSAAGVLAIWPRTGSRQGDAITISPATGMIGYPAYQKQGPIVRTLFNPLVRMGGTMKVQSAIVPPTATWQIIGVTHDIESQMPDGAWETTMVGAILGAL